MKNLFIIFILFSFSLSAQKIDKKDEKSKVDILIKHEGKKDLFTGWVTISKSEYKGKPKISSRLEFEKKLGN